MADGSFSAASTGPFPGQRPFAEGESNRFTGRESEARQVAALWRELRVTVLYSEAGTGKTSLLRAGVLPLVTSSGYDVLPVGQVADDAIFPEAALFDHNRYVLALLTAWAGPEGRARLSRMSLPGFIGQRVLRSGASATMIAIDHFDDLYRDDADGSAAAVFLAELSTVLAEQPTVHLLLVMRPPGRPTGLADLPGPVAAVELAGLDPGRAAEAIWRPLAGTGFAVEPVAASVLADELRVPDGTRHSDQDHVPPALLQAICLALWDARDASESPVSAATVLNLVDVDQCLARFVTAAAITVARRYDVPAGQLLSWLLARVTMGRVQGTIGPEESGGLENSRAILEALEDQHVLRADPDGSARAFTVQSGRLVAALQFSATAMAGALANPADAARRLTDAVRALRAGQLALARRLADLALRTATDHRDSARAQVLLGNIAFRSDDAAAARRHYLSAAEFYENLLDQQSVGHLLAAVGRLHLRDGKAAEAVEALHAATSRLRTDGTVLFDLARAFASSGEAYAAVAVLGSVLTADPVVAAGDAHLLRGEILADLGDAAGALRDLAVPAADQLAARAVRAWSLARLGQLDDAEEGIGEALNAAADHGPVLLRAAQIKALRGDAKAAERLLTQAFRATEPGLSQYQRLQADSLKEECGV